MGGRGRLYYLKILLLLYKLIWERYENTLNLVYIIHTSLIKLIILKLIEYYLILSEILCHNFILIFLILYFFSPILIFSDNNIN